MQEDKALESSLENAIRENIALETRIIELEAHITAQADVIEGLKKEVEQSLLLVSKADEDRIKLFGYFMMSLTKNEKEAIKEIIIREYGTKD
jgi:uncharacterized coiled-coil protein SlyX